MLFHRYHIMNFHFYHLIGPKNGLFVVKIQSGRIKKNRSYLKSVSSLFYFKCSIRFTCQFINLIKGYIEIITVIITSCKFYLLECFKNEMGVLTLN